MTKNSNESLSEFFHLKSDDCQVRASLDNSFFTLIKLSSGNFEPDWKFQVKDIIGSYIEESYLTNDSSICLVIILYPKYENNKRRKLSFELVYKKFEQKSKNLSMVKKFKNFLDKITKPENSKPFLVFLNPNSGSGKATKLYFNQVASTWRQANIIFKVIDTCNFSFFVLKIAI